MEQIQILVAGEVAVAALREAMTQAGLPAEYRTNVIGFFCNEWNARTKVIADAKQSYSATERPRG